MHNHHCQSHRHPIKHHGLMDVFGGIINLTTATLQGGATIIRTVVEGSVWHGCHWGDEGHGHGGHCGFHSSHHHYQVECRPHNHSCGCCNH